MIEHDSYTSRLYKENWDDAVRLLNEKDARIAELESALHEIAGVSVPLDSLEINHKYAVELARTTLGI